MISPNLFGLPIFSNFNFIFEFSLIFEIFFRCRQAISATIRIVEDVLATRHKLVTFVLPENSSAIVTTTREKSADRVPPDAIDRLLVVT